MRGHKDLAQANTVSTCSTPRRQTGGGFQKIKINQILRSLNKQKIKNYKTLSQCAWC